MEVQLQSFLTWGVAGLERSASGSDHSTSEQRVPGKHSMEGWVGGRGGLATRRREKSRVSDTNQTITHRLSNPQVSLNALPKPGIVRINYGRATTITNTATKPNNCGLTQSSNVTTSQSTKD
jgi:hypothetical protein